MATNGVFFLRVHASLLLKYIEKIADVEKPNCVYVKALKYYIEIEKCGSVF